MCSLVFVIQSDIIVCGNDRMLTAPYAHTYLFSGATQSI
jgi:hypothetical protein